MFQPQQSLTYNSLFWCLERKYVFYYSATYKARSSSSNAAPPYFTANYCKDQSTKIPPFLLNAF